MKETPQQYTKRILKNQQGKDPVSVLSSTPGKIARLLRGVSRRRLTARPGPGKWSVAEILEHLADAELVTGFRMRLILGANRTPIQAFDQDAWAAFSQYEKQDPNLSFEAFRIQRERNIRLLKSLPKKMWEYYGIHAERGKETIRRVTQMIAGHDINHLKQVERIVRGNGA
jgi:hypothetical protein